MSLTLSVMEADKAPLDPRVQKAIEAVNHDAYMRVLRVMVACPYSADMSQLLTRLRQLLNISSDVHARNLKDCRPGGRYALPCAPAGQPASTRCGSCAPIRALEPHSMRTESLDALLPVMHCVSGLRKLRHTKHPHLLVQLLRTHVCCAPPGTRAASAGPRGQIVRRSRL